MAIVEINEVGSIGLIKDKPAHTLPPEAWSDAKNVHMSEDYAKKASGHIAVYDPPLISAYGLTFVEMPSALFWLYQGLAKVYAVEAEVGTHTNVTKQSITNVSNIATGNPTVITSDVAHNITNGESVVLAGITGNTPDINGAQVATVLTSTTFSIPVNTTIAGTGGTITNDFNYSTNADLGWNGGVLGNIPVINNGSDAPQMWNPVLSTQRLQDLTNWPAATSAQIIRPFKQFLVALDITESGTRYPYVMRVSDAADPGAVPSSWDYTNPATLSIRRPLQEGEDFLIDCLPMRDTNIIYREHSVWGMQFIGGQSIWRTSSIFRTFGIMAANCAANLPKGSHIVATDSYDLVLHNGQTEESLLHKKMQRWLKGQLDASSYKRSFMVASISTNEAFFCFCSTGSQVPDTAIVWNWKDNSIGIQDLDSFAAGAYGFVSALGGATIDEILVNIDAMDFSIDTGLESRFTKELLWAKVNASPKLFKGHSGIDYDGVAFEAYLERTGITAIGRDRKGNYIVDMKRRKFLSAVYPRFEAPLGTVIEVYVGEQSKPEGPVIWLAVKNFTVGVDEKVDVMASAKLLAIKFRTTTALSWSLLGYSLDIVLDGEF